MKKVKNYLKKKRCDFTMDGDILVITDSLGWDPFRELIKMIDESKGVYYSIHEGRFQVYTLK